MEMIRRFFLSSLIVTVIGFVLAFGIGYYTEKSVAMGLSAVFICFVLSILEVSLSFDNAVVNAKVLNQMTPLWRHRFLTWGILIAVFGMRIVFPLAIVGFTAKLNPWEAIVLAAVKPDEYASAMQAAHIPVAAFGGSFLLMVALVYFFDANKDTHWLGPIERILVYFGKLESSALGLALLVLALIAVNLPVEHSLNFLFSGIMGLVVFIAVDGSSKLLEEAGMVEGAVGVDLHKASAAMFVYLEVLDASFSFDGVVGAFAITNNLFIIAIGLGIGAMFVRSLTVMLVEKGTLTEYRYLEHGAFWAIFVLAALMFAGTFAHISEVITGLAGAVFIALSFWSSVRHNKRATTR